MTITPTLILLIIAIICFVVSALAVPVRGVNLTAWGLACFAAAHLPI